jgi:Predicted transcriptional regulators
MAMKNKTMYAILGILSISPGSGYDIKKYCDTVISNFWNENFGHIYPVLNQMQKEDLIIICNNDSSARKKEYAITDKGKEEFLNWLTSPIEYQPVRSEFMLKLAFSNHLPKENIIQMLKEYKTRFELKLQEYKKMEAYFSTDKKEILPETELFLYAPLRHGILSGEATIQWCDEMIAAFELI